MWTPPQHPQPNPSSELTIWSAGQNHRSIGYRPPPREIQKRCGGYIISQEMMTKWADKKFREWRDIPKLHPEALFHGEKFRWDTELGYFLPYKYIEGSGGMLVRREELINAANENKCFETEEFDLMVRNKLITEGRSSPVLVFGSAYLTVF
ncbi:hypothetical protein H0H87_003927 [Tephrocybe sp. NHM501043]|nr:hypothetical protein H0H87_003927 [Tephrocybe sp. NHM501043]